MTRALPLLSILLLTSVPAGATECPAGMPACKVLFLSPQEEQILTQPNGILPTAADARKLDYGGAVQYFIQKIKDAPAGEVPAKPEPPKSEPPKAPADQVKQP